MHLHGFFRMEEVSGVNHLHTAFLLRASLHMTRPLVCQARSCCFFSQGLLVALTFQCTAKILNQTQDLKAMCTLFEPMHVCVCACMREKNKNTRLLWTRVCMREKNTHLLWIEYACVYVCVHVCLARYARF